MDTKTLIDRYTNDVARRLPRKIRNEVGLELRALLADELAAASRETGRSPDFDMTVEVIKKIGRPDVVAAQYGTPAGFNIIEPELAQSFVKSSICLVSLIWVVLLPLVSTSFMTVGEWMLWSLTGSFCSVGLLTVWYGMASWVQRRYPVDPHDFTRPWTHFIFWVPVTQDWQPWIVEPKQLVYAGAKILIPLSALLTVFFISPATWFDLILPDSFDTSWAHYDPGFRTWLLPLIILLMISRLVLFTVAVYKESLRPRTEPVRLGLWMFFIVMLIWALVSWDIFASVVVNVLFKLWLWVFVLVNSLAIWGYIQRYLARVRLPKDLVNESYDR